MSLKIHEDVINALIVGADVIARLGLRTLLQISGRVTIIGEAEGGRDGIPQIGAVELCAGKAGSADVGVAQVRSFQ